MTNFRKVFKYLCGIPMIFLFFGMVGCGNNKSFDTNQKIVSNEKEKIINSNSITEYAITENEEIIDSVQKYWNYSLQGNNKELSNYIRRAPEEFWNACPSESNLNATSNNEVTFSDNTSQKGVALGVSITEKKNTFWALKYFSEQIQRAKPELLGTRIIKSNNKEAIVKVDWRKANSDSAGISQIMLLYKENTNWKIFMMTDPLTLAKYNKLFATNDKCS